MLLFDFGEAPIYLSSPRRRGSSTLIQLRSRVRGNDETDDDCRIGRTQKLPLKY